MLDWLAGIAVRSLMQAAKFLFHDQSRARPDEGEKACAHHSPDTSHGPCVLVHRLRILHTQQHAPTLCLVAAVFYAGCGPMWITMQFATTSGNINI